MPELWQPIEGYEGLYQISNEGRVKSLERKVPHVSKNGKPRIITIRERILKPSVVGKGYLAVGLSKEGKVRNHYVHRLVISTYSGIDPGLEVNHKDLDKTNNRLENLEVVTHEENQKHAALHGRMGNDNWKARTRDSKGRFTQ